MLRLGFSQARALLEMNFFELEFLSNLGFD